MTTTDSGPISVVVWGEYRHERTNPLAAALYPKGIHETIAEALREDAGLAVTTATLDEPEHGLGGGRLEETDVLVWWGHKAHGEVCDAVAEAVCRRVNEGMGLVALHSAHYSKVFKRLMGTTCSLRWRESTDKERLWNIAPGHPITRGIGEFFEIPREEMYGEPFGIPEPDEVIFISWFTGGEVFRSGATWRRGAGRIFYFRPGHETYPTYHQAEVRRVIRNGVWWVYSGARVPDACPKAAPLEPLPPPAPPGGRAAGM